MRPETTRRRAAVGDGNDAIGTSSAQASAAPLCSAAKGALLVPMVSVALTGPAPGATIDGAKLQVAPTGNPEHAKVTGLANPLMGVIVSVVEALCPAATLSVVLDALMLNDAVAGLVTHGPPIAPSQYWTMKPTGWFGGVDGVVALPVIHWPSGDIPVTSISAMPVMSTPASASNWRSS